MLRYFKNIEASNWKVLEKSKPSAPVLNIVTVTNVIDDLYSAVKQSVKGQTRPLGTEQRKWQKNPSRKMNEER